MPGLVLLIAAMVVNYRRHRQHRSTICSTCRKVIPPWAFKTGWAALTTWLVPHYCNPFKNGDK